MCRRCKNDKDESGLPTGATICDCKSDRIGRAEAGSKAEQHRHQMALYRDALSLILSLDPDRITLQLIFTRIGQILALD